MENNNNTYETLLEWGEREKEEEEEEGKGEGREREEGKEVSLRFVCEILPMGNALQLLGRGPANAFSELYSNMELLTNNLLEVLKESKFSVQVQTSYLCTHCLEQNTPPLYASVFSQQDIEMAKASCSFVICGKCNPHTKVPLKHLCPELETIYPFKQIKAEELQKIKVIGKGSFSTVYLAKLKGINVAVKEYIISAKMEMEREELLKELILTSSLSCPRTVRMVGAVIDGESHSLVMEAMDCGWDKIVYNPQQYPITWNMRLRVLAHVAEGMSVMHEAGITHRDLKSANVLIRIKKTAQEFVIDAKVSDFNMSCVLMDAKRMQHWPPYFLAPEIMSGNPVSFLVDVYAFGVLAYETIARKLLFAEMVEHRFDEAKVRVAVKSGQRPPIVEAFPIEQTPADFFDSFKHIVSTCWRQVPVKRPEFPTTLQRIQRIQHQWKRLQLRWKSLQTARKRVGSVSDREMEAEKGKGGGVGERRGMRVMERGKEWDFDLMTAEETKNWEEASLLQ